MELINATVENKTTSKVIKHTAYKYSERQSTRSLRTSAAGAATRFATVFFATAFFAVAIVISLVCNALILPHPLK
jgi:mannose/fructose/N-acetylgalactosamine-specific phosphotransferase system component IIC